LTVVAVVETRYAPSTQAFRVTY